MNKQQQRFENYFKQEKRDQNFIDKVCGKRFKHKTKEDAYAQRCNLQRKKDFKLPEGTKLKIFKCPVCEFYHLGRAKSHPNHTRDHEEFLKKLNGHFTI